MEMGFSAFLLLPALVIGLAKSSVIHSSPRNLRILGDSRVPFIRCFSVIVGHRVNTAANLSQLS